MATKKEVQDKYDNLINSYHNFKPILASLYTLNGNTYVEGVANEIRALNDHIARCYRKGITINHAYEEICKAEGHLKRLIFDSFKQLNIIFHDFTEDYENKYFGEHWIMLDNGMFWNNYTLYRKEAISFVDKAKNNESKDFNLAFNYYQSAYINQKQVFDLINNYEKFLVKGTLDKFLNLFSSNKKWMLVTFVLAVVPALIWEFIRNADNLFNVCWKWLVELIHSLGNFLVHL